MYVITQGVGRNYLTIAKLQQNGNWSLGMDDYAFSYHTL